MIREVSNHIKSLWVGGEVRFGFEILIQVMEDVPWTRILIQVTIYRRLWLVEMTISTNQKPTIYRNLYENTASSGGSVKLHQMSVNQVANSANPNPSFK